MDEGGFFPIRVLVLRFLTEKKRRTSLTMVVPLWSHQNQIVMDSGKIRHTDRSRCDAKRRNVARFRQQISHHGETSCRSSDSDIKTQMAAKSRREREDERTRCYPASGLMKIVELSRGIRVAHYLTEVDCRSPFRHRRLATERLAIK